MPDYQLKARVIASGLVKDVKSINRAMWLDRCKDLGLDVTPNMDLATAIERRSFLIQQHGSKEYHEALNVAHANYYQTKRLKTRIKHMLETYPNCIFLTLTFKNDVLEKTSEETRRRYVTRFLHDNFTEFVGNIDFGAKNGREHYHVVANSRVDPHNWIYGDLDVKPVRYNPEKPDVTKLAKYVAKLTNHAIKKTTKRCALIYSRSTRKTRA